MPPAISNTSPLLHLYRADLLEHLSQLLGEVWVPEAVERELREGRRRGYDVPNTSDYRSLTHEQCHPSGWHWTWGPANWRLWPWL